ncbi:unnamed protein product [Prorocentrum cordatum]|nr:unnamed protein product [Polarella glacialis]
MTVSDDSIPVKPLHHIYWRLERSPRSRLCTDDDWLLPRAETWWVLRRGDAELFYTSRHSEFLQTFRDAKTLLPLDCDDENFYYLPLKTRMQKWNNTYEASFMNKCPMYTDWRTGERACKAWADHASLCGCESLGQHVVSTAGAGHPASFGSIGGEAFVALLRSPFWFARKILSHSDAAAEAAEDGGLSASKGATVVALALLACAPPAAGDRADIYVILEELASVRERAGLLEALVRARRLQEAGAQGEAVVLEAARARLAEGVEPTVEELDV